MVWVSHITAVGEVYPKLFSVHRLREMKVNFVLCLFLSLLLLLLFCYCYCFLSYFVCIEFLTQSCFIGLWILNLPSVFWHCWFGMRRSIQPVKKLSDEVLRWWGVVICLEWGAGLHMVQQMPCHCIPKPCYLLPYSNPDWSYLSGTGLSRFCKKKWPLNGCSVVIVSDLWMLCIFIIP